MTASSRSSRIDPLPQPSDLVASAATQFRCINTPRPKQGNPAIEQSGRTYPGVDPDRTGLAPPRTAGRYYYPADVRYIRPLEDHPLRPSIHPYIIFIHPPWPTIVLPIPKPSTMDLFSPQNSCLHWKFEPMDPLVTYENKLPWMRSQCEVTLRSSEHNDLLVLVIGSFHRVIHIWYMDVI